jgi:hypothetical protein
MSARPAQGALRPSTDPRHAAPRLIGRAVRHVQWQPDVFRRCQTPYLQWRPVSCASN